MKGMWVRIGRSGGGGGNRTRVLRGVSKSVYMLISLFVFSPLSGSNERDPEEISLILSHFPSSSEEEKPACLPVVSHISQARRE